MKISVVVFLSVVFVSALVIAARGVPTKKQNWQVLKARLGRIKRHGQTQLRYMSPSELQQLFNMDKRNQLRYMTRDQMDSLLSAYMKKRNPQLRHMTPDQLEMILSSY